MAKEKKGFILYCDIIHTIEKLSDEQAGKLFKHILKYVNDQEPIAEDIITEIAFEPIKQTLKRDLQKYEDIRVKNQENARKRWNATASERMQVDTKNAVIDKDIVKVKDKVIESIEERKIWEESDFPQKRIQEFTPANGKTKVNKAKNALNSFIEEVFSIDGSFKSTDHQPTPSKNSCMFCPYKDKKDLCSSAILDKS